MVNNMYYLNYFFVFSIIGHFIECFFYSSGDSGILFGYWTPIYGIGTVIILLIYNFIVCKLKNKFLKLLTLFLVCSITLSVLEATGGYLIKWIFNKELWDYSNFKFNIGKYTALEMSLIWGGGSLILIYFLKPFFDKIIGKIPKYFTYTLSILLVIDLILTIIFKR